MRKRQTVAGFTLIELLIVIAIIGILAAVLIPNILNARKHAYDAISINCASSLTKAAGLYKVDFPFSTDYPAVTEFTGNPDKYGTNPCNDTNLVITDESSAGSYQFTVKHLYGKKVYTVKETGMIFAFQ